MSVVDEVAALPDGQTLATIAQQAQGGPEKVQDLANRWSRAASDTTVCGAAVSGTVQQVGQTWMGSSNAAFADLMSQFDRACGVTNQSLSNAAEALTQVAFAIEEARNRINLICENLLTEVSQVRAVSPGVGIGDEQIRVLVGQATEAANAVITTLESAFNQASTVLSGELPVLSRTFSALPLPGGPDPRPNYLGTSASDLRTSDDAVQVKVRDPDETVLAKEPGIPVDSVLVQGRDQADTVLVQGRDPDDTVLLKESGIPVDPVPVDHGTVLTTAGPSGASPQVDGWIREATRILVASGVPASQLNQEDLALIIQHESSGDPLAVNNWDYNAAAGIPSKGLMQTIEPTFRAYALPGHGDIFNPVDNIIAGTRYALERYGSLSKVPGVVAVHNGQPYVGY